jgi:hypothetical protein
LALPGICAWAMPGPMRQVGDKTRSAPGNRLLEGEAMPGPMRQVGDKTPTVIACYLRQDCACDIQIGKAFRYLCKSFVPRLAPKLAATGMPTNRRLEGGHATGSSCHVRRGYGPNRRAAKGSVRRW